MSSISFTGSAYNNSNGGNYVLVNNSNQGGSIVLGVVPMDNFLLRSVLNVSSNSATPASNINISYGDSNHRMALQFGTSNISLQFDGSTIVSCNNPMVYNSNFEVAIRTRLDNQKIYINKNLLINYVGSNLDYSSGDFRISASNGMSNTVTVQYPNIESVFTVANSLEVLSSSKFTNISANAIAASSITTPGLVAMSNLIYNNTQTFTSMNTSNLQVTGSVFFDSNQIPNITAQADSLTLQVGGTSNDAFRVNKNGGVNLLSIQSGVTNSTVFNTTLDAISISENTVPLSTKYAPSNILSNYHLTSNFNTYSNWAISNFNTYSNWADGYYRKSSVNVPWSSISGAPAFSNNSDGSFANMVIQGLVSGVAGVSMTMAANGITVGGQSVMQWGTQGFSSLQNVATDFLVDGTNSLINGIKSLKAPNGKSFMSYDEASQKVSLLGDYIKSGDMSVRIDGVANRVAITDSNGSSNIILSPESSYFCSNFGIGRVTPTYKLDVVGDMLLTSGGNSAGAGAALNFQANYTSSPMAQIKGYLASFGYGATQDQGGLFFSTRSYSACNTSNMPLTPKLVIDFKGDVGVGTTTPSYKMDVYGTTRLNGASIINGTASNNGLGTLSANALNINYGNVQLGDTYGTGQWSSFSNGNNWVNLNLNGVGRIYSLDQQTTLSGGNMLLQGGASSTYQMVLDCVQGSASINAKATSGGGSNPLYLNNNGGSVYLNNSVSIVGGNVGIGNSSPASKLDVNGPINSTALTTGALTANSSVSMNGKDISGSSMPLIISSTYTGIPNSSTMGRMMRFTITCSNGATSFTDLGVESSNASYFYINRPNGSAEFTLNSSGNFGLGTTTPTQKLEVNGGIKSTSLTTGAITSSSDITSSGTVRATKMSCGYCSVQDYTANQSAYSQDLFSY